MFQPGSLLEAPAGYIRSPRLHSALPAWVYRSAMKRWSASAAALMAAPCPVALPGPLDPMGRRWLAPVLSCGSAERTKGPINLTAQVQGEA
jgi:hypothetical protein